MPSYIRTVDTSFQLSKLTVNPVIVEMEPNIAYNAHSVQRNNCIHKAAIYDEPSESCNEIARPTRPYRSKDVIDVATIKKRPSVSSASKWIALFSLLSILALGLAAAAVGLSVTQTLQQGDGQTGEQGPAGEKGMKGDPGVQGPPGPGTAGVTYIRWGRTTCPDATGTELVYSGRAAGTHWTHKGGSAEYICLPGNPDYLTGGNGVQTSSPLYGAEYETWSENYPLHNLFQHNVPCAVCYASTRAAKLMIPAKTQCPASWTLEYMGYLMSDDFDNYRTMYTCIDTNAESVPGSAGNTDGALFYHVEATCNMGIDCPPYNAEGELTCAVCTK